jgi:hypothetical protein
MSNSHYTCDSRSILTKTCRKPKPVAFALHLSQNGVSPGGFNLLSSGNLRPTGVIGGAQIGANYEFAPWVVGIEASLDRFCDRRKHPDRYNSGRDLSAGALHVSSQVVCCCDRTRRLRRERLAILREGRRRLDERQVYRGHLHPWRRDSLHSSPPSAPGSNSG